MALIFPQCSLTYSPLTHLNKGNLQLVHGGQMRVPQLKRGGNRCLIRCTASPWVTDKRVPGSDIAPDVQRSDFPVDFMFGGSTAAVQTEGAAAVDGRTPSTWDYLLTQPANNGKSYTEGPFSYKYYKEDVKVLKQMGVDVYRFSISWSRILPKGNGEVNPKGIEFYNNLINELLANGIQPFVTIFHLDLPLALVKEYNGFVGSKIVEDFKYYCDVCFKNFGDRVKYWGTINEPDVYAQYGYNITGELEVDDPTTYPYIVAKNIILAHATAVRHYKANYQATQGGIIGMTVSLVWMEPYTDGLKADKDATQRAFAFHTDLFVEPFVYGDYPFIIKSLVKERLPEFTDAEKKLIKGAYDFVGVNYYTARYTRSIQTSPHEVPVLKDKVDEKGQYDRDQCLDLLLENKDGQRIGEKLADGVYSTPHGLKEGLIKLMEDYGNPPIYITENGCGVDPGSPDDKDALVDDYRIIFIKDHLKAIKEAISLGSNVKSYIYWSPIDSVELGGGYDLRMGLNYTDYDNFERTPKKSAKWYNEILKKNPKS